MLWAAEAERSQTGALAPDVVWCGRCGAYSSAKVYNLARTCRGVPEKSARTRLTAFNLGIHPIRRHRLAPPVRLTDEVLAALSLGAAKRRAAFNKLLRGDPAIDAHSAQHDSPNDDGFIAHNTAPQMEPEAPAAAADFSTNDLVPALNTTEEEWDAFNHGYTLDEPHWEATDPEAKRRRLHGQDGHPAHDLAGTSATTRSPPLESTGVHIVKRRRLGHVHDLPSSGDLVDDLGTDLTEDIGVGASSENGDILTCASDAGIAASSCVVQLAHVSQTDLTEDIGVRASSENGDTLTCVSDAGIAASSCVVKLAHVSQTAAVAARSRPPARQPGTSPVSAACWHGCASPLAHAPMGDRHRDGRSARARLSEPSLASPARASGRPCPSDERECKRRRIRGKCAPPDAYRGVLPPASGPAHSSAVDQHELSSSSPVPPA